jgi:hypothetical protein
MSNRVGEGLVEITKIYSDTDLLSITNFQVHISGNHNDGFLNLVLSVPDG